jgi:6-pyruvoyltetrahydropterin/6-carboxytetrahydropterin synthase
LKILKQILEEEVEDRFDHKNLNLDTSEFKNLNPTAENIAITIWNLIRKRIEKNYNIKVTLYETERNFVEYNGN